MDSVEESPAPESFDVDEWDENFINEVLQIELGLAAKNAVAKPADPPLPPPPVNPSSYLPGNEGFHRIKPSQPIRSERGVPPSFAPVSGFNDACFSPPRELSQRFSEVSEAPPNGGDCVTVENKVWRNGVYNRVGVSKKNTEVERLKKELEHLSKKFKVMEQDCITLKRDRDKKGEQLNCIISKLDAKDAEIHSLKRVASPQNQSYFSMPFENKAPSTNYVENNSKLNDLTDDGLAESELKRRVMLDDNATTSCGARERSFTERSTKINHSKSTGIQTDINEDIITIIQQRRMLNEQRIVSNLHATWGLCDKRSGNTLVSKLLKTCSEDFFALFRCTNCNHNELTNESISEMALDDSLQSIQSSDAAKASKFYQSLMKMRHEIVPLQVVIDALLDLCNLNNVTVAHVSLHILHAILQDVGLDSSSSRSNVFVGQSNDKSFIRGGSIAQRTQVLKSSLQMADNANEAMPISSNLGNLCMGENQDSFSTKLLPFESLVNIFETMRKIVVGNLEEYIRLDGLSIMCLIVMKSKLNTDRDKFCTISLLQTLSSLMSREVGVHVRKQAMRLLFLLFNTPRMLLMLCSGQGDGADPPQFDDTQKSTVIWQGEINSLLGNIADCVALNKSDAEELEFRRRIIILLAFVASSGKNGFELLLRSVTSQEISFLELIIQLLAFEMDAEIPVCGAFQNFCKERISLIREVLILLNRLTSHPTYSDATLRVLTGRKATSSLTIDIANRLLRRIQCMFKQQHGTKRTQASAEINDLARLFQLRVFSFLGVPIS